MFTENDLKHYLYQIFELPQSAIDYIENCYYNEPSRMVGTHAKTNIISWVPSKKLNGKSFSTESRGPERALNTISQLDENVFWHADQPEPIKIEKTNKNGIKHKCSYTPDAISLKRNGPVVIEAKCQHDIERLLIEKPEDWQRTDSEVVFLPARKAFADLGLRHELYIYKPEDRYYIANLEQILWVSEDINDIDHYEPLIAKELNDHFCLSLADLKQRLKLEDYSPLIFAIGKGWIITDLKEQLITDTESCLVSSSLELLKEGLKLKDLQRIYFPELTGPISLSLVPEKKAAEDALFRLSEVNSGKSNRNIRRWRQRIDEGKKQGLTPFQSLISLHHKCGNRSNQINIKVKEFLNNYLSKTHISRNGISLYRGYIEYHLFAKEAHPEFDAVCRRTFTRHLSLISPEIRGQARGGKRLGHAMALPSNPEERNLKAQVAWQCASIDHSLVKLFLIAHNKKEEIIVEKPWLTTMIDQYTGKILSFSFSFRKPSRHSIAKVLRACVRSHKKLPREISTDRGSDFRSTYFASLLAHYSITLSLRASGNCRSGSEVERFFGEFGSQWLSQRDGNSVDYKNARSIDGKKAPRNTAILSPADFHRELTEFCNWRDNICRGIDFYSIGALFEKSQDEFPHIARPVQYDNEFIVSTCVEAKEHTFNNQKGVNIKNIWYSSPLMHLLLGKPRKNEVRLDPENPNLIFVRINDNWIPFFSSAINSYSVKNSAHQLAEGLIKHEASALKRRIREQDDAVLAELKRQMDLDRSNTGVTPLLEVDINNDSSSKEVLLFSDLKQAQVRPLNRQNWSS